MATPAAAKWREAQSENFVIYADDSDEDIREFAELLEGYHRAMEVVTGRDVDPPSPSNRVTIFAVGSERDMDRLTGSRNIAGFYVPRAGFSRAFVQNIRFGSGRKLDFSMSILLHEYAHHFLMSTSRFAMPRWMSEGAAEFFASAGFEKDGTVVVGRPNVHRAYELAYADEVSARELLDHELYKKRRGDRYDAFYGRSWLLYHYLVFENARDDQLKEYWTSLALGKMSEVEAAEHAFGDLDQLEDELKAYGRARRMYNFTLTPEMLQMGNLDIKTRELSEGHADMMPLIIRSQRGVDREEALEIVEDARKVAKEYPNDPWVLAALAEAEFDAGENERAIAAADRAIAFNPNVKNAYIQKGYAMFRMAGEADDKEAGFKAAMEPFSALNRLENDHPLPLIYFYRSFMDRGEEPNELAKHALERAAELAPFDRDLWFQSGLMQMREGKNRLATYSLSSVASDPHGGKRADVANALVEALDGRPDGEIFDPTMLLTQFEDTEKSAAAPAT